MGLRRVVGFCLPAAAGLMLLPGCGGGGDDTVTRVVTQTAPAKGTTTGTPTTAGNAGAQAAVASLESVVDHDIHNETYHTRFFRSDPMVSQQFVDRVDEAAAKARQSGAQGLDFDPILCSQNVPEDVTGFEPQGGQSGDRLEVIGTFAYGGTEQNVTYTMVFEDSAWKLADSSCLQSA